MRIHLDTDLGGDPDDVCALALLLGWPGVELVGITTTIDPGGERAACTRHCLALAGHEGVPVVAGAAATSAGVRFDPYGEDWWPPLDPAPAPDGAALDLLAANAADGATIVAIGPYTNLGRLAAERPGVLRDVPVVVMGGWTQPPAGDLPAWGPDCDFNVQADVDASVRLARSGARLTLATLPGTMRAHLRERDLPRLRASGPLGALIAEHSERHAAERQFGELAAAHAGLPDDLVNFHYDPVAAALAAGWDGARVEQQRLAATVCDGLLHWTEDPGGPAVRVLHDLDAQAFTAAWLAAVAAAQRS